MLKYYPVCVSGRAPTGRTNAYLVDGKERLLVDPAGKTSELDDALTTGSNGSVSQLTLDHIVVTHTHSDHVDGVATYADETDATVWAHTAFTERFERVTGVVPDRYFRPGDSIGTTGVTVMGVPGHAPDHVAFVLPDQTDAAITHAMTGDLVFADSSVFVGATDGDMRAYLSSLRRVLTREFDKLHPGHGKPILNPDKRLRELYFHRKAREQRVLRAVERGAESVPEIVKSAYDTDLSGVRDLAGETVRAHLDKLRVESHVEWDGERASPP